VQRNPTRKVCELGVNQIRYRSSLPLVSDQQIMISCERLHALSEGPDRVFRFTSRRLTSDCPREAKHGVGAMVSLMRQKMNVLNMGLQRFFNLACSLKSMGAGDLRVLWGRFEAPYFFSGFPVVMRRMHEVFCSLCVMFRRFARHEISLRGLGDRPLEPDEPITPNKISQHGRPPRGPSVRQGLEQHARDLDEKWAAGRSAHPAATRSTVRDRPLLITKCGRPTVIVGATSSQTWPRSVSDFAGNGSLSVTFKCPSPGLRNPDTADRLATGLDVLVLNSCKPSMNEAR
jgi:hypothetical protein